ncbi:LAQU0S04e07426g1_1 [Lachancea quebecensis]|uniref:Inheritance of peroxisomes protein 2 n=1 Tax=Lachancea quebecensis TaxID=1654605 RepID=A0A0P1KY33_9SACH|nr:LAQU0S04e07426g1_1 [Lachancea quebecensis]
MSCDSSGDAGKGKLPGLQIFSHNWNRSNSTLSSNMVRSTQGMWMTDDGKASRLEIQARKLSDWGVDTLNDNSPTVVGSAEFGSEGQEVWLEHDIEQELAKLESERLHLSSKLEILVSRIFLETPFSTENFVEEFQYTIIASQLLTDCLRPRWIPPKSQRSMLDFHGGLKGPKIPHARCVPTKYGKFTASERQFVLRKTVPFLPTLMFSRHCFGIVMASNAPKSSKKRLFAALATAVYLALQQELFYSQYVKHSTLLCLRSVIEQLQGLDKLLHRLHMRYKELTIYKPISLIQATQTSSSDLSVIRDVLSSSLDLMFYEMKRITGAILPLLHSQDLTKYCEIYAVNLVDVFYAVNEEAVEVGEKAARTHTLKKFVLCCLLSIDHGPSGRLNEKQSESILGLYKAFSLHEKAGPILESKKSAIVLTNLKELEKLLANVNLYLKHNRPHGMGSVPQTDQQRDSQDLKQSSFCTSATLNMLKELQKTLIASSSDKEEELANVVIKKLEEISKLWIKQNAQKNINNTQNERRKDRHFSGLQLNVVQSPTLDTHRRQSDEKFGSGNKVDLNSEIEFKIVQGSQSDLDLESDEDFSATITEEIYATNSEEEHIELSGHKECLSKLTDEELRNRLNERIMSLARENRQGKEELRTKKSFGLLGNDRSRKEYSDGGDTGSRPSHRPKFISEESIPVLYELKQLLEDK